MDKSGRTSRRTGAAIASWMALAGWAQADGLATVSDRPQEIGNRVVACGSVAAPAVDLVWPEVPDEDGVSFASGHEVTLRVGNRLDHELRARTEVTLRTPDGVVKRRLPEVRIPPHGSTLIPVSLEEWAASPPAGTSFVLAFTEAWAADGKRVGRAIAPPLYLHDDRGTLVIYGEAALRHRFGGGVTPLRAARRGAETPTGATLEMTFHGSGERQLELEPRSEAALQAREQDLARVPTRKGEER